VRAALGEAEHLGVRLRYVIESEPLGTGAASATRRTSPAAPSWVLNGDVLTDADLSAMRAFHEAQGSRTTIFLHPVLDPRPYGLVETRADGRVERFREKPAADEPVTTNTINAGVYSSMPRCSRSSRRAGSCRLSVNSSPPSSPTACPATAGRRTRTGATSAAPPPTAQRSSICSPAT